MEQVTQADRKIAWPDPTPEMLKDAKFEAIWQMIKSWDINVPEAYAGYMGATGNHARAILEATRTTDQAKDEEIARLKADRDGWKRLAHDAANKIEMILPMLGPKGCEVVKAWADQGITRMHVSWGPEGIKSSGEERAQIHLDIMAAMEGGESIEDVDEHIQSLRDSNA